MSDYLDHLPFGATFGRAAWPVIYGYYQAGQAIEVCWESQGWVCKAKVRVTALDPRIRWAKFVPVGPIERQLSEPPPSHPNCRCSTDPVELLEVGHRPLRRRQRRRRRTAAPRQLVNLLDMPPADRAVLIEVLRRPDA